MRNQFLLAALLPALGSVEAIRIIHANDDGWAELYTRSFHEALVASGHDTVLSAPAENKSGTGSSDQEPSPRTAACQYNSCAPSAAPIGRNESSPRLNWVNSFPVTSMRYGIDVIAPPFWNNQPAELAVSGPNVGSNLYVQVHFSGTVGSAVFAAKERKIPAIAFSGLTGGTLAWNTTPVPTRSLVYAQVASKLVEAVIAAGKPYLPENVFLNVNLPKVEGECTDPAKYKFVLSRINFGLFSEKDVTQCGSDRLPMEATVAGAEGCYVSVSVGDANDKTTASADKQKIVRDKLRGLLTCLP